MKDSFFAPLVAGRDVLEGLHANTHLAQARSHFCHHSYQSLPISLFRSTSFARIRKVPRCSLQHLKHDCSTPMCTSETQLSDMGTAGYWR